MSNESERSAVVEAGQAETATSAEVHTFMFADLAGFTALTEAHGDNHAADLALDFATNVNGWLESVGGGDLKLIGDAVMVRTSDATAALELALMIVDNLPNSGDYPAVRIGLNTGAAAARNGDWFGAAVNLAARVAAHAAAGEVLATTTTVEAAGGGAWTWEQLGPHEFRNVREAVDVFRAGRSDARPAAALATDPVCRMRIDPTRAAASRRHGGAEYVFCSLACADAFAKNPSAYIS